LSFTEAAEGLGVTRQALLDLANERAGISVEMAIRPARAFGSSPETWLGLQMACNVWQARARMEHVKIRQFSPAYESLPPPRVIPAAQTPPRGR
jgi:antitoxin HigA-1